MDPTRLLRTNLPSYDHRAFQCLLWSRDVGANRLLFKTAHAISFNFRSPLVQSLLTDHTPFMLEIKTFQRLYKLCLHNFNIHLYYLQTFNNSYVHSINIVFPRNEMSHFQCLKIQVTVGYMSLFWRFIFGNMADTSHSHLFIL